MGPGTCVIHRVKTSVELKFLLSVVFAVVYCRPPLLRNHHIFPARPLRTLPACSLSSDLKVGKHIKDLLVARLIGSGLIGLVVSAVNLSGLLGLSVSTAFSEALSAALSVSGWVFDAWGVGDMQGVEVRYIGMADMQEAALFPSHQLACNWYTDECRSGHRQRTGKEYTQVENRSDSGSCSFDRSNESKGGRGGAFSWLIRYTHSENKI
ncbi:hypothetical protein FIBSPDRAFT_927438 [Athelia psychrophila]|uniref:Uncharacterized protein n=1 Tax=Athelia psychrophila TaxID=1759441 RepID=A0A166RU88_9AGAM|nr:hypothetical protein FIBSPDRAFT_927438 [Fibularhizoctonia sp. CBS 109695]